MCKATYFLHFNATTHFDTSVSGATLDSKITSSFTMEMWLKIDNPNTFELMVVASLGSFKLRKKSLIPQIQVQYNNLLSYCDTSGALNAG